MTNPDDERAITDLVAMEHATTVLAMEIARLHHLAENDTRLRTKLVLDLVGDAAADGAMLMNSAQALGYDLSRSHRVVLVEEYADDEIDLFFHAVSRAARALRAGASSSPDTTPLGSP